jgi:uncharacterized protein
MKAMTCHPELRGFRIDRSGLIAHLRSQFLLSWHGHHGIGHWVRVRANGLMLAKETGANLHVVELFAFIHDARRKSEGEDHSHGSRAGALAVELRGQYFDATDDEMDLLVHACRRHSDGLLDDDMTVMTCWDSDRLDLGRVGIVPDPVYLCTGSARCEANYGRAQKRALAWKNRVDSLAHS